MRFIDLRSDTVTKPTEEMLESIIKTNLGDDVYGEDPTVNQLEKLAASMLGKESALLVSSGTQGNQLAVLAHTQRGDEVILERYSHIFQHEVGALSSLSGIQPLTIVGRGGLMDIDEIIQSIREDDIHSPKTRLICLENPHNSWGGTVLPLDYLKKLSAVARNHQIKMHLDGARIFNASVALGVPVSEISEPFDSVQFCLSKGLCAPIGSILAGSVEFIGRARKYRKMLGGGMRQAGIIAAPGIIAITKMVTRLKEDHRNATELATALADIPQLFIDLKTVHTNMVYATIKDEVGIEANHLADVLESFFIRINVVNRKTVRLVTHKDIGTDDILRVVDKFQWLFGEGRCCLTKLEND